MPALCIFIGINAYIALLCTCRLSEHFSVYCSIMNYESKCKSIREYSILANHIDNLMDKGICISRIDDHEQLW
jgi:hypothetical protein